MLYNDKIYYLKISYFVKNPGKTLMRIYCDQFQLSWLIP